MSRRLGHIILSLVCAAALTGCAVSHGPVTTGLVFDMKGPVAVGSATGSTKVGRAEAWGIVVYGAGDASIAAAMKNGGITRIHHVDNETTNILGIYAKYVTIVYGE
jgi:TRL-like protein family